jgi:hypothetical protein
MPIDSVARSAHLRRTRKVVACIVEAMDRRRHVGLNKRCAG